MHCFAAAALVEPRSCRSGLEHLLAPAPKFGRAWHSPARRTPLSLHIFRIRSVYG